MAEIEERQGSDITYADMILPEEEPSEIQEFYRDSTIFITGGTGFLGNLLIEKLLRSCSDLKRIYVLVRAKKGKTPESRFEEMFQDILFDKMRSQNPKFIEQLSPILGDCELPDLGLSKEDKQKLIDEVNIVIHAAATVRFDETLLKATRINVRATRDIMIMTKKMKNLKAMVHVSTAFSNCTQKDVDERFYNVNMTGDKLIEIVELLDAEQIEALTKSTIGRWPNTYTYTKAVAESLVHTYGKGLPVSIVRPSIVTSTAREPLAGWINNFYGPVGISAGAAFGLLHTLHGRPGNNADIVPADYCINSVIASGMIIGHSHVPEKNNEVTNNVAFDDFNVDDNIPIFNYVSSAQNAITWQRYMELSEEHGKKFPSPLCLWHYWFSLQPNKYIHNINVVLLHYIPGIIFDMILRLIGRKPMLMKAYRKIQKFSSVLVYFTIKQWTFKDKNTQAMWKKLNKTDKNLFYFDINTIDWDEYFYTFVLGGRVYLLKDPIETLPQGRRKARIMKYAHYTLVTLIFFGLYKLLSMILFMFI